MKTIERIYFFAIFFLAQTMLVPLVLSAQMQEFSEEELSAISAQAGINFNYVDFGVHFSSDSMRISDTDHTPRNWIELNNFTISGPDGYFKLDCPPEYPMTIDVGTSTTIDEQAITFVQYQLSDHINPRTWNIGSFVFCNVDLGSIMFDTSTVDPSVFRTSSRTETGSTGIDFEYLTRWNTKDFSYTYNPAGQALQLAGINLSESVSGDPSDPSSWTFSGPFRVGDLYGGTIDTDNDSGNQARPNPATMDVSTDASTGQTCMYLNLPMKGTIRVEKVNFGGTNFGPIAIDGITAHHIGVRFNPY